MIENLVEVSTNFYPTIESDANETKNMYMMMMTERLSKSKFYPRVGFTVRSYGNLNINLSSALCN